MTTSTLLASPARLLLRNWWVILATTLAVLATTAFFTQRQTPVFQARASILLRPDRGLRSVGNQVDTLRTMQPRAIIATYSKLPASRGVRVRVQERLELSDAEMKAYSIRCSVVPDTFLLSLSVEHEDPARAAEMAVVVFEETSQYAKGFYRIFGLTLLDSTGEEAVRQVRPQVTRSLTSGFLVGLLAGTALAVVIGSIVERRGAGERGTEPRSR